MPTSIHEIFTELVVQEIWSQLRSATREDDDVVAILDSVRSEASSDIRLYGYRSIKKGYLQRSPDASLAHVDSQYPSVIIETAYAQRRKDLVRLADEYICGSDGNISVILRLDIEYSVGSRRASVSIWRPRFAPDPEREGATILEMVGVQEDDVMPSLPLQHQL